MTKMVKYLLGLLVILALAYAVKPSWFRGEGFEDEDEGFEDDEEGFEDEEEGFEDEEEGFEDEDD